jgi:hypothetical protein
MSCVSSHNDKPKRGLDQDLIEQLPSSAKRTKHAQETCIFSDSLNDREGLVKDIIIPILGQELFLYCYNHAKSVAPISNIWRLDIGKLDMPNILSIQT